MATNACPTAGNFCGQLTVMMTEIQRRGGEKLDQRIDKLDPISKDQKIRVGQELNHIKPNDKTKKINAYIKGNGKDVSYSVPDTSRELMTRDYPEINNLKHDDQVGSGLTFIPPNLIPKNFDLDPNDYKERSAEIEKEISKGSATNQLTENLKQLKEKLEKVRKENNGVIPEKMVRRVLEKVFGNSFSTIVIHSLNLVNPRRGAKADHREFDFLVLDLATATLYIIEAKRTLGPKQAEKAQEQISSAMEYLNEWFGADVAQQWTIKPIVFCTELYGQWKKKDFCQSCKTLVAFEENELLRMLNDYKKTHKVSVTEHLLKDYKLMARYLIFGLVKVSLPTARRFHKNESDFMKDLGQWDSILYWCFLRPDQMAILSEPKAVLHSGFGGGKTITGFQMCQMWYASGLKVKILVNGSTVQHEMLLVHDLRLQVEKLNLHIEVLQIDIEKDNQEDLVNAVSDCDAVFVDEVPRDYLFEPCFHSKFQAMVGQKKYFWCALTTSYYKKTDGVRRQAKENHLIEFVPLVPQLAEKKYKDVDALQWQGWRGPYTGLQLCQMWSEKGLKVKILVNAGEYCQSTVLLDHDLGNRIEALKSAGSGFSNEECKMIYYTEKVEVLKACFPHYKLEVLQINIQEDSLRQLMEAVSDCDALFIDDIWCLWLNDATFVQKLYDMLDQKMFAQFALTKKDCLCDQKLCDMLNQKRLDRRWTEIEAIINCSHTSKQRLVDFPLFLPQIGKSFKDFKIVDTLKTTMRNSKTVFEDRTKMFELNVEMELGRKERNLNKNIDRQMNIVPIVVSQRPTDHLQVLDDVLQRKNRKAIIITSDCPLEMALVNSIIQKFYKVHPIVMSPDKDKVETDNRIKSWIHSSCLPDGQNVIIAPQNLVNGFEADVIICLETCQGPRFATRFTATTRAINVFINHEHFNIFLRQTMGSDTLDMVRQCADATSSTNTYLCSLLEDCLQNTTM